MNAGRTYKHRLLLWSVLAVAAGLFSIAFWSHPAGADEPADVDVVEDVAANGAMGESDVVAAEIHAPDDIPGDVVAHVEVTGPDLTESSPDATEPNPDTIQAPESAEQSVPGSDTPADSPDESDAPGPGEPVPPTEVASDEAELTGSDAPITVDALGWTVVQSWVDVPLVGVATAGAAWRVVVGDGGTIARSTDGGATWSILGSPTTQSLSDVAGDGALTFVAVGTNGAIVRSGDAGASWSTVASGTSQGLNSVAHVGGNTFLAVGFSGTVLRSTDGGVSWSAVASGTAIVLWDVGPGPSSTLVAVGQDWTILRSTNGGASWSTVTSGSSTADLWGVGSDGVSTWVAVGEGGAIVRSTDGGASWTTVASGTSNFLSNVGFGSSSWIAVGVGGTIVRSTDGGATWSAPVTAPPNDWLYGLGSNGATFFAVGRPGTIVRSSDDGATWVNVEEGYGFRGSTSNGGATFVAVGEWGRIARSTDAGVSWSAVGSPTAGNLLGTASNGALIFVAVGAGGTILRSGDGGASWTAITSPTTSDLWGVSGDGAVTFIAVGASGTIVRSTDGGANWSAVVSGMSSFLTSVTFSGGSWVAVGDTGTILRSTNGGVSWTLITSPPTMSDLWGVAGDGAATFVAVGRTGTIVRSTDGAATWSAVASGTTLWLPDVAFGSGTWVVVGDGGTILESIDGGASWAPGTSPTSRLLWSVAFGATAVVGTGTAATIIRSHVAAASLTVSKAATPDPVRPSQVLSYTITYANDGGLDVTGVQVSDYVPAAATFNAAASTAGWSCAEGAPAGTLCTFSVGSLAVGSGGTVVFAVTVDDPTTATEVTNGSYSIDSNQTAPTSGAPVTTLIARVAIAKTPESQTVVAGGSASWALVATNTGGAPLTGVLVTDTLPVGLGAGASAAGTDWTCGTAGDVVTCAYTGTGGTLAPGSSAPPIALGVADVAQAFTNTAAITTGQSATDNDTADVTVSTPEPDLDIDIVIEGTPMPGRELAKVITVRNNGTGDARDVSLTDILPAALLFLAIDYSQAPGWSCAQLPAVEASGTIQCVTGVLMAGDSGTFIVYVRVDPAATAGTRIVNVATLAAQDARTAESDAAVTVEAPAGEAAPSGTTQGWATDEEPIYEATVLPFTGAQSTVLFFLVGVIMELCGLALVRTRPRPRRP